MNLACVQEDATKSDSMMASQSVKPPPDLICFWKRPRTRLTLDERDLVRLGEVGELRQLLREAHVRLEVLLVRLAQPVQELVSADKCGCMLF